MNTRSIVDRIGENSYKTMFATGGALLFLASYLLLQHILVNARRNPSQQLSLQLTVGLLGACFGWYLYSLRSNNLAVNTHPARPENLKYEEEPISATHSRLNAKGYSDKQILDDPLLGAFVDPVNHELPDPGNIRVTNNGDIVSKHTGEQLKERGISLNIINGKIVTEVIPVPLLTALMDEIVKDKINHPPVQPPALGSEATIKNSEQGHQLRRSERLANRRR